MRKAIRIIAILILTTAGGAMAKQRKYSVAEIEEVRRVVENKYLFGMFALPPGPHASRQYLEVEKVSIVEAMVQTYMQSGLTAEDLVRSETEKSK